MAYSLLGVYIESGGSLHVWFSSPPLPNSLRQPELTLNVGNKQFALADATLSQSDTTLDWGNSGLSWEDGDTVRLRLTVDVDALNLPSLTASVSPDRIVEGSDLWSATLTVQDLTTTPASAPANRGCDDSQGGVQCSTSSVLTDNDFTFKGVDYTVKAISYNQRKVAPDPNNVFNITTYPESLKLTLNKAIPESLQSCLTLHAGNAKVPFADDGVPGAGVDTTLSGSTLP